MKKENIIHLSAFLLGVITTNILKSKGWIDSEYLYRHHLLQLSFEEIRYDTYLIEILFLRFRTVVLLWLVGKIVPIRWLHRLFGGMISAVLGAVLTLSILANGVWGVMLMLGIIFPQWLFYIGAYMFWGTLETIYIGENNRKRSRVIMGLIILLVIVGCILEAYINPVLLKYVIKC